MNTSKNIPHLRLTNQRIAHSAAALSTPLETGCDPHKTVATMGMLQAQDYLGALWAVGLRTPGARELQVEDALETGQIVRTWPARGTLHFVAAEDVRWLLELLAPRVIQRTAGRYRQLGLTDEDFDHSRTWVKRALAGGNRLTRPAIYQGLEAAGVSMAGQRGIHILGRLAMEGLICFGPRDGKQQTFLLLGEWIPQAHSLPSERALTELARRYFSSHGPATAQDFAWWSGLKLAEVRAAMAMIASELEQVEFDGGAYWQMSNRTVTFEPSPTAHVLPGFDEYLVGYLDRSAVLDPRFKLSTNAGGGMLSPVIVIDGQVLGTWKRKLKKDTVVVTPSWFIPPEDGQIRALEAAVRAYAAFLGLEASF